MYYRYKSKTRNLKFLKYFIVTILVGGALFGIYMNRHYFMFWKYTFLQMKQRIDQVRNTADIAEREKKLNNLLGVCREFEKDNPLSAEAFLLSGEVHFQLAESMINQSFSRRFIRNGVSFAVTPEAGNEYLNAVKCFRKAIALSGNELEDPYKLMLVKSGLYTGYYNAARLLSFMGNKDSHKNIKSIEDVRACAVLYLLTAREDEGINFLLHHGKVNDTVEGQLFMATAYSLARKYTSAIMQYQNILRNTTSSDVQKLVHMNLGKIYFNQSLYAESLGHFTNALQIDERDVLLKIWIGKNYSALGDKTRAKAIWSEVLTTDSGNEEARKLLKLM